MEPTFRFLSAFTGYLLNVHSYFADLVPRPKSETALPAGKAPDPKPLLERCVVAMGHAHIQTAALKQSLDELNGLFPGDQGATACPYETEVLAAAHRLQYLLRLGAILRGDIFPKQCEPGAWPVFEKMALAGPARRIRR